MKSTAQSADTVQHVVETPAIIAIPKGSSSIRTFEIPTPPTPPAIISDLSQSAAVPSLQPLPVPPSSPLSHSVPQTQSTSTIPIPETRKIITRSQHGIFKKKQLFVAEKIREPTIVKQALQDPNWTVAMHIELEAL